MKPGKQLNGSKQILSNISHHLLIHYQISVQSRQHLIWFLFVWKVFVFFFFFPDWKIKNGWCRRFKEASGGIYWAAPPPSEELEEERPETNTPDNQWMRKQRRTRMEKWGPGLDGDSSAPIELVLSVLLVLPDLVKAGSVLLLLVLLKESKVFFPTQSRCY